MNWDLPTIERTTSGRDMKVIQEFTDGSISTRALTSRSVISGGAPERPPINQGLKPDYYRQNLNFGEEGEEQVDLVKWRNGQNDAIANIQNKFR